MKAYKLALRDVPFSILQQDEVIPTLEGPVPAVAGSYVLVGVKGERWPMSPAKFHDAYDVISEGLASKRKVIIDVIKVPSNFQVEVNWTGAPTMLSGKPGDWLAVNGDDAWAIADDVFHATYQAVGA